MRRRVEAAAGPLRGEIRLPPDKSIAHRALILAAIAEGTSRVHPRPRAADVESTAGVLRALGARIHEHRDGWRVEGHGLDGLKAPARTLDCGNSGTTMRLVAGLLAGRPFAARLDGDASLRRRPMERVGEPLRMMGAEVRYETGGGRAPLWIKGRPLRGIRYRPPMASAQVKSALLLAGLQAAGETVVEEPVATRDHTERMLRYFGAEVRTAVGEIAVRRCTRLEAREVELVGDLSSAMFFAVAATLVPGSLVRLAGVGINPSRCGGLEILRAMGARVGVEAAAERCGEPAGVLVVSAAPLHGVTIEGDAVPRAIDELIVLSVAAGLASGTTVIRGAAELRVKESDRIAAVADLLRRLGVSVEELADGLRIEGSDSLRPARVESRGDHRIAMAAAIAALRAPGGVEIEGAECVEVSYPGFFADLERLRGGA